MNGNSESSAITNATEGNIDKESEARIVTRDDVNEQMRSYIAPLTKTSKSQSPKGLDSVESLMSTVQQLKSSQKADTCGILAAVTYQPEMVTEVSRPMNRRLQPIMNGEIDDEAWYHKHDRKLRTPSTPEVAEQYNYILDTITTLPRRIKTWAQTRCYRHKQSVFEVEKR